MTADSYAWFDTLPVVLKRHLWDRRSQPLSPEVLIALLEAGVPVSGLYVAATPQGRQVRLDYEGWEYIWSKMSPHFVEDQEPAEMVLLAG